MSRKDDEENEGLLSNLEGGSENKLEQEPINYAYMDGIRGLGSFSVYLSHFFDQFYPIPSQEMLDDGWERILPDWLRNTPAKILYHGYFWVIVFFILSGFVLPMNFFRSGRQTCITGGTFRRYLRLMLPVLMIVSLYYLCLKLDFMGDYTFERIKTKTFVDLIFDTIFLTWFGDDSWSTATWTLSIELFATFFIYLLSQTAVQYRNRYWIYFGAFLFIWFPMITDFQGWTKYKVHKTISLFPVFFVGTILADLENIKPRRPLDGVRKLSIWWKIPLNLVAFALFVLYGSFYGDGNCILKDEGDCEYHRIITINHIIPKLGCTYIGAIALIFLALTSQWFQYLLASPPL